MARVVERFGDLVFDTVITRTVRFPRPAWPGTDHHLGSEIGWRPGLSVAGPRGHRSVRHVTATVERGTKRRASRFG